MTAKLSGLDKAKISARAKRSMSSVERVYRGDAVNPYTFEAIVEAATALGLPPPPAPKQRAA